MSGRRGERQGVEQGGAQTGGVHTYEEIMTQAGLWEAVIARTNREWSVIRPLVERAERVVFVGCGSNYYMSLGAAFHFTALTGKPAWGVPASELQSYPEAVPGGLEGALVVTLCRSGETTEVVQAVEAMRRRGVQTLYLGCAPDSTVARLCSASLDFAEARDRSVVTTRSHTVMLLAAQLLAGLAAGERGQAYLRELGRLPSLGKGLLERLEAAVRRVPVERFGQFVFLGSGPFYGIACEGMLKMKEMAIVPSDGLHCLEFRHGPKAILEPGVLVTVFLSDTARGQELGLIREIKALGGAVMTICQEAGDAVAEHSQYVVETAGPLAEAARSVLYLPAAQLLAFAKAASKGIDVDAPRHLSYHVSL